MRSTHIALLGVVVMTIACDPPSHPRQLANTITNNICDFNFDCCAPSERNALGLTGFGGAAPNKGECVEELNDQIGGAFAEVVQAIDDGTAIYDAEAAEACTATNRAALDSCDSQVLLDSSTGNVFNRLFYLVDDNDTACSSLAARAFTRGTVGDGRTCVSSFECEDFGRCVFVDDEGNTVNGLARPATGTCKTPPDEGEPCEDDACGPGLECRFDTEQAASFCAAFEALGDGDPCNFDDECKSNACVEDVGVCSDDPQIECTRDDDCGFDFCFDGSCDGSGAACEEDADCEATCDAEPAVCGAPTPVTVEICNGL